MLVLVLAAAPPIEFLPDLLDTARCFPPTAVSAQEGGRAYLYRLFRPEFVKRWRVPLCSDTFSKFAQQGADEHRAEVVAATAQLELELVPAFAQHLDAEAHEWGALSAELPNLVAEAHLRGINVRYLLLVYSHARNTKSRRLLATEVAARLVCRVVNEKWRAVRSSDDGKYVDVFVQLCNRLFAPLPAGDDYLRATFLPQLATVFVLPAASAAALDLRDISRPDLLVRVCAKLHAPLALDLSSSASLEAVARGQVELHASQLRPLQPVLKHTNRVSFEEGTALVRLAMSKAPGEESVQLLRRACDKFAESVQIRPGDHTSLYNWGLALQQLAQQSPEPRASDLRLQCNEKFERALRLRPRDWKALHKWGTVLLEHALTDRAADDVQRLARIHAATEKLERALSLHPRDFAVVYNAARAQLALGRALGVTAKAAEATQHYTTATELFQRALTCDHKDALSPPPPPFCCSHRAPHLDIVRVRWTR